MANRSEHLGIPRHGPGPALRTLVCSRCGNGMVTAHNYHGGREVRYFCAMEAAFDGAPVWPIPGGSGVLDETSSGWSSRP